MSEVQYDKPRFREQVGYVADKFKGDPRGAANATARRVRKIAARRYHRLRHRGRGVSCPCCGWDGQAFAPFQGRLDAACPRCGSVERHRALWLFLCEETPLLQERLSVLHFAPEPCLRQHLERLERLNYVTADLNPRNVMVPADITDIPLEDALFDLILCSHVLEHIEDDQSAMRELRRVLKPSGTLIVLVPIDSSRATTYEDHRITTPEARQKAFGQYNHVRLYGRDLVSRLQSAGLAAHADSYPHRLGDQAIARFGLFPDTEIFVCRPDPQTAIAEI